MGKLIAQRFNNLQYLALNNGRLDWVAEAQAIGLVDIKHPDLQKHPRYIKAFNVGMSVEFEAGDAIFIPTLWWHHVELLSLYNVLINYWWSDQLYQPPCRTRCYCMPLHH